MKNWLWFGLGVALFLAIIVSPLASSLPDGLERVAEELGFSETARETPIIAAPVPDYTFPGVENAAVATGLAGLIGTLLVFLIGIGLAHVLKGPGNQCCNQKVKH